MWSLPRAVRPTLRSHPSSASALDAQHPQHSRRDLKSRHRPSRSTGRFRSPRQASRPRTRRTARLTGLLPNDRWTARACEVSRTAMSPEGRSAQTVLRNVLVVRRSCCACEVVCARSRWALEREFGGGRQRRHTPSDQEGGGRPHRPATQVSAQPATTGEYKYARKVLVGFLFPFTQHSSLATTPPPLSFSSLTQE